MLLLSAVFCYGYVKQQWESGKCYFRSLEARNFGLEIGNNGVIQQGKCKGGSRLENREEMESWQASENIKSEADYASDTVSKNKLVPFCSVFIAESENDTDINRVYCGIDSKTEIKQELCLLEMLPCETSLELEENRDLNIHVKNEADSPSDLIMEHNSEFDHETDKKIKVKEETSELPSLKFELGEVTGPDSQCSIEDDLSRTAQHDQKPLLTEAARARKPRRRWWVHPLNQRRIQQGDYHNLLREMKDGDPQQFFHYMRLKPAQFDEILDMLAPLLQKRSNRAPLPPAMRLCITLRFLATGSSIPTLARSYRIGKSTCCQIINETTQVIWHALHRKYLPAPTECDYRRVAMEFKEIWNVPNCVGAIDGKHVIIQAPTNSGIQFNHKNSFSVVLMAVCDAKYCFTHVDIGVYGSQSEGGIFRNSQFGIKLLSGLFPLPSPTPLHPQGTPVPYHFLGDEAFPLSNNLMRPFAKSSLINVKRKVFNFHLSRVRRVIENTLGILVARWQIFHRVINAKPENVDNIIRATVCLHNYLRLSELHSSCKTYCPPSFVDRESNGVILEGEWRQNVPKRGAFQHLSTCHLRLGSRNACSNALNIRECISDHFISPAGVMNEQVEYVSRELCTAVSSE